MSSSSDRPLIEGIGASLADLPIRDRADEIAAAIADHQVVVVAGETGSGKSTQLPRICLALGRGTNGRIGHTQPRRIAARSIAERISSELGTDVGTTVGYAVRFTDTVGADTRVKVMTDGILLAEIQRDRQLSAYDTLIIDEAHERSLNIDFLLGCLKQLLPRRPDLKLVITSATIDTERFSSHFDDAPVISVSGRTYPVEVRYRPTHDRPLPEAIVDAVRELWVDTEGDVLVFCSGERDIRDAARALGEADLRGDADVFPLYARLSAAEQQRVFRPHRGRRIVLATNVAETSLTVPGIRSVVDPGLARISRYSARTKVQRLPIEPISQASADQRAGRCGRVAPGVCIRLYEEDDYLARPEFTEPEIQRTNLASVVLQMASLGLGDIERFPFVEPPDGRNIRDGIALLEELGALDPDRVGTRRWLTRTGRELARLPIDPRLGRMVLEASHRNCLDEVMIITAALSIQDPRERPSERREAAATQHARFADPRSDFLALLHLWRHAEDLRHSLSGNQYRKRLRAEFLNVLRMREWHDVYRQVRRVADQLDLARNRAPADPDDIHRALLAGFLGQVGMRERSGDGGRSAGERGRRDRRGRPSRPTYLGPRNARFVLAPGAPGGAAASKWIMAAELVETDQLRARTVAAIEPRWIEEVGDHLLSFSYTGAEWDAERGAATVIERVALFGLPVVAGRRVLASRVAPELARDLLIEHAFVHPEWPDDALPKRTQRFLALPFHAVNERALGEALDLEARARRSGAVVGSEWRTRFFDDRLPADVATIDDVLGWWKRQERSGARPDLTWTVSDLIAGDDPLDVSGFPDVIEVGDRSFAVSYEFDATSPVDGMTVDVPVEWLHDVDPAPFGWLVDGLRAELLTGLIRTLPKDRRRAFLPVAETVASIVDVVDPSDGAVETVLADVLGRRAGLVLDEAAFRPEELAPHLRPTFRIVGTDGEMLAAGKDLIRLRSRLDARARRSLGATAHPLEMRGLASWPDLDDGRLPDEVDRSNGGHRIVAFPALVDRGATVDVALFADRDDAAAAHWGGVRRLLRSMVPLRRRAAVDRIDRNLALAIVVGPHRSVDRWLDDLLDAAIDDLIASAGGPPRTEVRFRALRTFVEQKLAERLSTGHEVAARITVLAAEVRTALDRGDGGAATDDLGDQLDRLVYDGVFARAGWDRLPDLVRYLEAAVHRLERIAADPGRDRERAAPIVALQRELDQRAAAHGDHGVAELLWMMEELRVSVFAQHLGTRGPVSVKRVRRALQALPPLESGPSGVLSSGP